MAWWRLGVMACLLLLSFPAVAKSFPACPPNLPAWLCPVIHKEDLHVTRLPKQLNRVKSYKQMIDYFITKKQAEQTGCGKSDQPGPIYKGGLITIPPHKQVSDTVLFTTGLLIFQQDGKSTSYYDSCEGGQVKERFCVTDNTIVDPTQQSAPDFYLFHCPTGQSCQNGQCVKQGSNGCLTGQAFLDVTGNGAPDSCICPDDMLPIDTNANKNSDTCIAKGVACSKQITAAQFPDATINELVGPNGAVEKVINYCAPNDGSDTCAGQVVTHTICTSEEIWSTSTTPCAPGMQCQKGVCVPTGGGTCDASAMNLAATQVGCVALTDAKGEQSFYCDQCDTLDPTKVANAACGGSCQQTLQWVTAWCAPGAICDPKTGACTGSAPPDDGINCAKTPELPECQNVDCAKTPNDPKCIDGGGSSSNGGGNSSSSGGGQPPCIPQTTPICEADTDSGQDVHLYGTLQSGIEISGCLIPPPSKITNPKGDTCVFAAGKPILYQYSCNGAAVVEQAAWCDVASGEDCDPKATTPETKGICQPFVSPECTDTSSDSKNLTQVGSVEGKDGFGHPFKETDHCEPAQGFGAVIKWSCLTGGSQGRKYDLVFCPNAAECIEGVCVPLQPPDVATCEKDPTSPACKDSDKDGIVDAFDNCVNDYNPQQEDSDGDTLGDACDAKPAQVDDTDKDGVPDPQDNCVQIPNPDQKDGDADGIGDACDNPTLDCGKTPNDPQCACPSGPPPQCDDTDKGSNLFFRGDVTMTFNGGGTVKQGDFCVDDFSAVIEVQCGPCGKFGFHKFGCPSQQCKDGQCGL